MIAKSFIFRILIFFSFLDNGLAFHPLVVATTATPAMIKDTEGLTSETAEKLKEKLIKVSAVAAFAAADFHRQQPELSFYLYKINLKELRPKWVDYLHALGNEGINPFEYYFTATEFTKAFPIPRSAFKGYWTYEPGNLYLGEYQEAPNLVCKKSSWRCL